jgi:hypothetical protein
MDRAMQHARADAHRVQLCPLVRKRLAKGPVPASSFIEYWGNPWNAEML